MNNITLDDIDQNRKLEGSIYPPPDTQPPYTEEELRSHSQSWPTNQAFKTADRIADAVKAVLAQNRSPAFQDDRYTPSEAPGGFRDQINAIRAEMEHLRHVREQAWLDILVLREAIKARRTLCSCRKSDAWRCARDLNLDTIACKCVCHIRSRA